VTLRSVIYARQSLDRSGEGAAVDRQIADCRALASDRGWDVVDVVIDNDVSASSAKVRPGYQRVLQMVDAGSVDRVIVWAVDRLTRKMRDLEDVVDLCERTGVSVATVSGDLDLSSDMGRLVARILASVARGETERKGTRQKRANLQRAQAGNVGWTRRPFGYDRKDGKVHVVDAEAEAIRDASRDVIAGATLASVARDITSRDLLTTAGKPWNVTSCAVSC
jgi:site-specific DNA recombinase